MDCLFCKIINNEVDSLMLYEDNDVKVILDAFPDSPGHTLIIPKSHYKDLDDIPITLLTKILEVAKVYKKVLESTLNPDSIVLIQNNGFEEKIKHFHLHLIPKYNKEITLSKEEIYNKIRSNKVHF